MFQASYSREGCFQGPCLAKQAQRKTGLSSHSMLREALRLVLVLATPLALPLGDVSVGFTAQDTMEHRQLISPKSFHMVLSESFHMVPDGRQPVLPMPPALARIAICRAAPPPRTACLSLRIWEYEPSHEVPCVHHPFTLPPAPGIASTRHFNMPSLLRASSVRPRLPSWARLSRAERASCAADGISPPPQSALASLVKAAHFVPTCLLHAMTFGVCRLPTVWVQLWRHTERLACIVCLLNTARGSTPHTLSATLSAETNEREREPHRWLSAPSTLAHVAWRFPPDMRPPWKRKVRRRLRGSHPIQNACLVRVRAYLILSCAVTATLARVVTSLIVRLTLLGSRTCIAAVRPCSVTALYAARYVTHAIRDICISAELFAARHRHRAKMPALRPRLSLASLFVWMVLAHWLITRLCSQVCKLKSNTLTVTQKRRFWRLHLPFAIRRLHSTLLTRRQSHMITRYFRTRLTPANPQLSSIATKLLYSVTSVIGLVLHLANSIIKIFRRDPYRSIFIIFLLGGFNLEGNRNRPQSRHQPPKTRLATVRFRFHNVKGLSSATFRKHYLEHARRSCDVLMLAETNCPSQTEEKVPGHF